MPTDMYIPTDMSSLIFLNNSMLGDSNGWMIEMFSYPPWFSAKGLLVPALNRESLKSKERKGQA